jgi:hypothetical protein
MRMADSTTGASEENEIMKIAQFAITGNGSILMHNPVSMRVSGKPERGGKKIPTPIEEATKSLYALPSGQLYVKSDCFREAGLIAAGSIRDPESKGRRTMTARFAASVFIIRDECPLFRATNNKKPITTDPEDWTIDTRRVVVQRQGILRSRAKISDWSCDLEFEYDEQTIDPLFILTVLEQSGKYPGILDYRVGKKGPFGRFTVALIDGVDMKKGRRK